MHQNENRDTEPRRYTPEVIVSRSDNGRFWAAVVRTGVLPAGIIRQIHQVKDCASSNEALEMLYIVSQNVIRGVYAASPRDACLGF
jgi:hypothetical protein